MKYMGSKARIAKDLAPIINQLIEQHEITTYIEPFVGGSNMIEHIQCDTKYGYDNNEYLIAFWKEIQNGWDPLKSEYADMSKEQYQDIKDHKNLYPKSIVALAGFCSSYNAKWFGGYAGIVKTKVGTVRNYYHEAVRNVMKQAEKIGTVCYECKDFREIDVSGALIYCDPPYQDVTRYRETFDHDAYWNWVRKMSTKNIVLCSEYSAPADFECIYEKQLMVTLDKNNRHHATEKLYVFRKENKQMELKMNEYQLPEKILFNYEELKQELTEKVSHYETLVYTDDQIKEAKADRANLNRLKKALNDERIRREKEYMQPFNTFKTQINEIIGIIDKPMAVIDKQVKAYEDKQKQDKMDAIKNLWESCDVPEGLVLDKIFDQKWLNASVSMKSITAAIDNAIAGFNQDMDTLSNLPEFGFEAQQVYIRTLDINKALAEGQRMAQVQKQKAEYEAEQARRKTEEEARKQAEQAANQAGEAVFDNAPDVSAQIPIPEVPVKQWVAFQALMTTEDALALKDFFNSRNIEFKAV